MGSEQIELHNVKVEVVSNTGDISLCSTEPLLGRLSEINNAISGTIQELQKGYKRMRKHLSWGRS